MDINKTLAQELKIKETQVAAAVALMDDGNTIPFIARYRKEATGGLDDQVLRALSDRLLDGVRAHLFLLGRRHLKGWCGLNVYAFHRSGAPRQYNTIHFLQP